MNTRKKQAQSTIETVAGILLVVPLALFLLDAGTLVMASMTNADIAKSAARAAASGSTASGSTLTPTAAAQYMVGLVKTGGLISSESLTYVYWNPPGSSGLSAGTYGTIPSSTSIPASGQVLVSTTATVVLPCPLPMLPRHLNTTASAVEPIVSVQPSLPGYSGP